MPRHQNLLQSFPETVMCFGRGTGNHRGTRMESDDLEMEVVLMCLLWFLAFARPHRGSL